MNPTITPLAEGQIYSNAFNYVSAGVDPRTGLYSASISLPGGVANALCGPNPDLTLRYSVLNPLDQGFGQGWSLVLSTWDPNTQHLSLATGESFRGEPNGSSDYRFLDCKLPTFRLRPLGRNELLLIHKDGTTERLAYQGDRFVPVEIRSADGHSVHLEYVIVGSPRLQCVRQADQQALLTVKEETLDTVVTLWPEGPSPAVVKFRRWGERLSQVILPGADEPKWTFDYQSSANGLLLLTSMTVPTGGKEEVQYDETNGLTLPAGGPMEKMPVVTRYTREPGNGQPAMVSAYTYNERGTNNFYGYGAVHDWANGEDNLYRIVTAENDEYQYGSQETVFEDRKEIRTIKRIYNRFHLMLLERTEQDGYRYDDETEYHDDPTQPFDRQPAYCQLPKRKIRRYAKLNGSNEAASREENEETCYDESGNPIWVKDARGMIEEREYYPVSGSGTDCPADPLGFVRFLKSIRVTQPDPAEPIQLTCYRYAPLPSKAADGFDHVVMISQTLYRLMNEHKTELIRTEQQFIADQGMHHGLLQSVKTIKNELTSTTEYEYALDNAVKNARGVTVPSLRTTITEKGHDGTHVASHSARSLLTGQEVMQESGGTEVRYAHDVLGRVVEEAASPDDPQYAAVRKYRYTVCAGASMTESESTAGLLERDYLDGLGRSIRREQQKDDGSSFYVASELTYNGLGQVVCETTTDLDVPGPGTLNLTTRYEYDVWGNQEVVVRPDGVREYTENDPIALTVTTYQTTEVDDQEQRSGRTVTVNTPSGKPLTVTTYSADGQQIAQVSYTYDGAERTATITDAAGNVTRYAYDDFNRLIETTLADGAKVQHDYAVHSDAELTTHISIVHPSLGEAAVLLGEREYDGLDRLTCEQTGQRVTRYDYPTGKIQPSVIHTPNGEQLQCDYLPQLSGATKAICSSGKLTQALNYTYDYDRHGRLTRAENALGSIAAQYLPRGQLETQTSTYDGDKPRTSTYTWTPGGLPTSGTMVDGTSVAFIYDALGRVASKTEGNIHITVDYDAFGRPSQTVVTHTGGEQTMTLSQTYDSLGRETERTLRADVGSTVSTQSQTLTYTAANKLARRTIKRNDSLVRDEQYDYDERGRLTCHTCSGPELPPDNYGTPFVKQRFTYDALDNIVTLETEPGNGETNVTTFGYSEQDPTQLMTVTHSRSDYPAPLTLQYDAAGNLLQDEAGRQLSYDAMNRLSGVRLSDGERQYQYAPSDKVGAITQNGKTRHRYYSGTRLEFEKGADDETHFVLFDDCAVAQTQIATAVQSVMLLGSDAQGSVVLEAAEAIKTPVYGAYGYRNEEAGNSAVAYCGELRETEVGWYLLDGYRVYNPVLMRFHSPDAASPFGEGGLNKYAYCSGDPINRIDPTGESWLDWLMIGIGVIGTAIGVALSAGTLAPAASALLAGTITASQGLALSSAALGVVSASTSVASAALNEAGHEEAGGILGWVSMGTGIASAATGIASSAGKAASGLSKRVGSLKAEGLSRKTANKVAGSLNRRTKGRLIFEANLGDHDVYFHDNLFGQNIVAYETHGSKTGQLMNSRGVMTSARAVAQQDILPELQTLTRSYPQNEPLMLIACWGGKSGAAQEVANVLRRPVIGFNRKVWISQPSAMQKIYPTNPNGNLGNLLTHQRTNQFGRVMNHLKGRENTIVAKQKWYFPV